MFDAYHCVAGISLCSASVHDYWPDVSSSVHLLLSWHCKQASVFVSQLRKVGNFGGLLAAPDRT